MKWMNCKKKMPKIDDKQYILVAKTCGCRYGHRVYYAKYYKWFSNRKAVFVNNGCNYVLTGITHWMEIPKPPKPLT